MKLHLIRHAKAENQLNTKDINRQLAEKGLIEGKELGEYLTGKINSCEIWCSGANRTRQTLDLITQKHTIQEVDYKPNFYLCSKEIMLKQIWEHSPNKDVVIIGHNFGISDLLNYFTDARINMRTGEYICVDFGELTLAESSKNTGTICDQFRFTP